MNQSTNFRNRALTNTLIQCHEQFLLIIHLTAKKMPLHHKQNMVGDSHPTSTTNLISALASHLSQGGRLADIILKTRCFVWLRGDIQDCRRPAHLFLHTAGDSNEGLVLYITIHNETVGKTLIGNIDIQFQRPHEISNLIFARCFGRRYLYISREISTTNEYN